jgi:hypothetical protein
MDDDNLPMPTRDNLLVTSTNEPEVDDPKQIRERVCKIKLTIDAQYLELGKLLYKVIHRKLYLEWGYGTFRDYCDTELGFKERKAQYLASLWKNLKVDLQLPDSKVDGIEWTKLREATKVMDADNAEQVLDDIRDLSHQEVLEYVRDKQGKEPPPQTDAPSSNPEDDEPLEKWSITMYRGQRETLENALEVASSVTGSDKRCHLLSTIALEYLAAHIQGSPEVRLHMMVAALEKEFKTTLVEVKDKRAAVELKQALAAACPPKEAKPGA